MEADNKYNLTVGQRIREIRESGRMTRSEFGKKCGISERIRTTKYISCRFLFVAAVESGKKSITTHTLYKICTSLEVSADYLIRGKNEEFEVNLLTEKASDMSKAYRDALVRIVKEYVDVVCSETQQP